MSEPERPAPTVHPDDVKLALLLRKTEWLCESLAHAVPCRRADTDDIAQLMDALPLLEQGLQRHVARQFPPIVVEGEIVEVEGR